VTARLDDAVLDVAVSLAPSRLRTLDALHLATALTVKEEIGAFFAYDERLREAAADHGLPVAPGG
jgi:predicted nucleic acid-binding protein